MKKSLAIFLILTLFSFPSHHVKAVTNSYNINMFSGTSIRLSGEISSEKLTSDIHDLAITIKLLSLNESAVAIYNIRVDYRIPEHFSQYRPFVSLSEINSTSQASAVFQYDAIWGNCTFEMKVSFIENNTLTDDPTFATDWMVFFNLEPFIEITTPTSTETSTYPTLPHTGFDWGKNWYIFLIIGVGVLLILLTIRISINMKSKIKDRKLSK